MRYRDMRNMGIAPKKASGPSGFRKAMRELQELRAKQAGRKQTQIFTGRSVCYWCGMAFMRGIGPYQRTIEHIIPRSHGGGGGAYNTAWSHRICNNKRGSDTSWIPFSQHGEPGNCYRKGDGVMWRIE